MGRGLARGPSRIPAGLFLSPPPPVITPPLPFCTAIILYYKLALFPDGQRKHARKTQNHTHEDGTLPHTPTFSLRGASSVYTAASGSRARVEEHALSPAPRLRVLYKSNT